MLEDESRAPASNSSRTRGVCTAIACPLFSPGAGGVGGGGEAGVRRAGEGEKQHCSSPGLRSCTKLVAVATPHAKKLVSKKIVHVELQHQWH